MAQNNSDEKEGGESWKQDKRAVLALMLIIPAFIIIFIIVLSHWHFTLVSIEIAKGIVNDTKDLETIMTNVDSSNQSIYNILVPVFAAWVTAVVAFYFGSKQAEKAAEDQIKTQEKAINALSGGRFAAGLETTVKELLDENSDIRDFYTINFNSKLTSEFYKKMNNYGVALVKFVIPEYYTQNYSQLKDLLERLKKAKDETKKESTSEAQLRKEFLEDANNQDLVLRLLNSEEFDDLSWEEKYELIKVPDSNWKENREEAKKILPKLSTRRKQDLFGVSINEINSWKDPELFGKFEKLPKEKRDSIIPSPTFKKLGETEEGKRKIELYYEKLEEKLHTLLKRMDENLPNWETRGEKFYDNFIGNVLGILYVRDLGDLDNYKKYEEDERTLAELIVNEDLIDAITERRWRLDPEKRIANFAELYYDNTFEEAKSKMDLSDNSDEARGIIYDNKETVVGIISNFTILDSI